MAPAPVAVDIARIRSITLAAKQLREALDAPPENRVKDIAEAKAWLLSAAEQQEGNAAQRRNQMFAEAESSEPDQLLPADAMLLVATDLHVANTLLAAGNALEETDAPADPNLLSEAVTGMETIAPAANRSQIFAFVEPIHSKDLSSARDAFRNRASTALDDLVAGAKDASGSVITSIKKLDPTKVWQGLEELGAPLPQLPKVGDLFRKGIEKLQKAIGLLTRMIDSDTVSEVKVKLEEFWPKIMDGTWADALLAWTFNLSQLRQRLAQVKGSETVTVDQVDSATDGVGRVQESFDTQMKWVKSVVWGLGIATGLLLKAGATAVHGALFAAGAYLLVFAFILATGRDGAGSGRLFYKDAGLATILGSVLPA